MDAGEWDYGPIHVELLKETPHYFYLRRQYETSASAFEWRAKKSQVALSDTFEEARSAMIARIVSSIEVQNERLQRLHDKLLKLKRLEEKK